MGKLVRYWCTCPDCPKYVDALEGVEAWCSDSVYHPKITMQMLPGYKEKDPH